MVFIHKIIYLKKGMGNMYINRNNVTYFDSFEGEHIPKENEKLL